MNFLATLIICWLVGIALAVLQIQREKDFWGKPLFFRRLGVMLFAVAVGWTGAAVLFRGFMMHQAVFMLLGLFMSVAGMLGAFFCERRIEKLRSDMARQFSKRPPQ